MARHLSGCLLAAMLFLILCPVARAQDDARWERYLAAGNAATMRGREEEAEEMFRAALREAEERFEETDERLMISLRSLALTLKVEKESPGAAKKLAEAEQLFGRLLSITANALGAEDRNVAFVLDEIAEVNLAQGKTAEAEAAYKRALKIQLKNLKADASNKNRSAYSGAVNHLADLYCTQGRYEEAKAIDKRVLPRCVEKKQEQDLLVAYPKLPPQERVQLWLGRGGLFAGVAGTEMENELTVRGLDAVPYLAEIVRRGKGDDRLAALQLLCRMDRFVTLDQLPEGVPGWDWIRLSGAHAPAGRLNDLMIVDGRRIGKEGIEAVRWAAEQQKHDDLKFHAREYSGLMKQELRQLSLDEQLRRWSKAASSCRDDPGMNDDCTLASLIGDILAEKPDEVIPPLIEILELKANSYVGREAFDVLRSIDHVSLRLRGTETGRRAIEAMRRALSRCNFKSSLNEREECRAEWERTSAELFDDKLETYRYDWLSGLETLYGLQLREGKFPARTAEARRFVDYLTKVDPYFPSWEFTYEGDWANYALHPRFKKKWERYYDAWQRFKAESDKNEGRR